MRRGSDMRIAALLIAGLITASTASPVLADRHSDLKACTDAAYAKAKAARFSNKATDIAMKEMDLCSEAADRAWDKENPKKAASDDSYYEFQAWKANEDYKRDVDAINREYDLRRSSILP